MARDRRVADIYSRFLDTALAQPRVRPVVFWGRGDAYSWLNETARTNYARADGLPGRPLPFDSALQPKAAWRAIKESLQAAPIR